LDTEAFSVKSKRGASLMVACARAALSSGCFNTPTPLAPGLHGTVGVPNRGVLTEPAELPARGPGFVRYRPQSTHYFARPRLVHALEDAALAVWQRAPGGAPLAIGDLSAKTGGRIPGHDSHRTGRDVDLLFLVTTPQGVPVPSLDVDREWWLLRSLLISPDIGVQFMFVCREIEALLIDHARALGEPDALLWQAETVMLQPSDSLRHDDHVHLRIACSPEEANAGCSGGGPRWQWLPPYTPVRPLNAQDWAEIARDDPFDLAQASELTRAGVASDEARDR
jgi:penicillin-insensitive murein endopeptidase